MFKEKVSEDAKLSKDDPVKLVEYIMNSINSGESDALVKAGLGVRYFCDSLHML